MKNNDIVIYNKHNNILIKIIKHHHQQIKTNKYKNQAHEYYINKKIIKKENIS